MQKPTRLIIVGGFLGAGKTTLLLSAARRLSAQGYRVGLVTNDQGEDLVDTALAAQGEIPVTEVAGGCFCCRFTDLLQALQRLQATVHPDIILAEPVGSCTDLVATVLRPLAFYHPTLFDLAPLTILLDANRNDAAFPAQVRYLYDQQLAEARLLLVSKADQLAPAQRVRTLATLQARYPDKQLMFLAAQSGEGVDAWLAQVLGQIADDSGGLNIDYERYAAAEAALGWLNAKGIVRAGAPFSPEAWMQQFLQRLDTTLTQQGALIAHVKLLVTTADGTYKASLIQSGTAPTWDLLPVATLSPQMEFVLNARVCIDPPTLEQAVQAVMEASRPDPQARYYFTHFECFRPLPPKPTQRL